MIDSSELSIVIQGPIVPNFKSNLKSIYKFFPNSEVIVSTWNNESLILEEFCKNLIVIYNEDVGGIVYENTGIINNVNRLILSTRSGIKASSKKYLMKLRSDMFVTSNSILYFYNSCINKFLLKDNFSCFENRILVWEYYTRHLQSRYPYPFHISDIFYLGLRNDIEKLFNIPFLTYEENNYYLNKRPKVDLYTNAINKYAPEQYIILSFIKHNTDLDINLEYQWDLTNDNSSKYESFLVSNFVVCDIKKYGIIFNKYKFTLCDWLSVYSFQEWVLLYKNKTNSKYFSFISFLKTILRKFICKK